MIAKRIKFHPERYSFSSKFTNYLSLKRIKLNLVYETLQGHGISKNTIKTFLKGSHVPNSYISHLIEEIWDIRFESGDFKEGQQLNLKGIIE